MPNFHPHLVAAVAQHLEQDEEVWAVYPAARNALVATATRLFVVGRDGVVVHPLHDFVLLHRASPTLALLERRSGGMMAVRVDPRDEHGVQALTVIGLLVAMAGRPGRQLAEPVAATSAPRRRRRRAWRHVVIVAHGDRHVPAHRWVVFRPRPQAPEVRPSRRRAASETAANSSW